MRLFEGKLKELISGLKNIANLLSELGKGAGYAIHH